jgi:protein-S-isoprenylcysteine O-methyltransferase Ste14
MRSLENRIPPPAVVAVLGFLMAVASKFGAVFSFETSASLILCGVFVLSGVGCVVAGFRALRRSNTTINPLQPDQASSLVVIGIYNTTRNPMYVGFASLLFAWAFFLANYLAFVGPIFFILFTNRFQIIPEERALIVRFGDEYGRYLKHVRRWI